jgi:hypothetical protein
MGKKFPDLWRFPTGFKRAGGWAFWISSPTASFGPTIGLFVGFDQYFLDFIPKEDATAVANWLVSQKIQRIEIEKLAEH